jgi:peptide/nickel transport system substrate-binding protein
MARWNDLSKKRWLLGLRGLYYFMTPLALILIYWSSLMKEEQSLHTHRKLVEIENRLNQMANTWQFSVLHQMPSEESLAPLEAQNQNRNLKLLSPDPFYRTTLPRLLGYDFKIAGTRRQSFTVKPENLHPFTNDAWISPLWDLCMRSMGRTHVGFYNRLAPSLAFQIEIRPRKDMLEGDLEKTGEFWVFLRKDLFWDPINTNLLPSHLKVDPFFLEKHAVTAWDVKFYYDAIMNPYVQLPGAIAQRELFQDVESFEVVDDYTFVVRWKLKPTGNNSEMAMTYSSHLMVAGLRPLPRFIYQYYPDGTKIIENDASDPNIYRHHSVWAQVFIDHWAQHLIVGCGDWQMATKTPHEMIFRRNVFAPDPYGALNENLEYRIRESIEGTWQDFKDNRIDFCTIQGNQLIEKERFLTSETYQEQIKEAGNTIRHLRYAARAFTYIGWNLKDPKFEDKRVRQALTQAIDREAIIRQILSGQAVVTTGPFHIQSPSYDPDIKPYPYDPVQAGLVLDKMGWIDQDRDGIREKVINGEKVTFSFRLTYYVKNPISKMACQAISDQLRRVGIQCLLNGVDVTDFSKAMDEKNFDAIYLSWQLGTPPETTRQLWHSSSALSQGSSNFIGYQNSRVDHIIEQLDYCYKSEERLKLYHEMHHILHEDQPYTFMYCPITIVVYRDRLKNMFLPVERQDFIPGAETVEPQPRLFYIDPQPSVSMRQL